MAVTFKIWAEPLCTAVQLCNVTQPSVISRKTPKTLKAVTKQLSTIWVCLNVVLRFTARMDHEPNCTLDHVSGCLLVTPKVKMLLFLWFAISSENQNIKSRIYDSNSVLMTYLKWTELNVNITLVYSSTIEPTGGAYVVGMESAVDTSSTEKFSSVYKDRRIHCYKRHLPKKMLMVAILVSNINSCWDLHTNIL